MRRVGSIVLLLALGACSGGGGSAQGPGPRRRAPVRLPMKRAGEHFRVEQEREGLAARRVVVSGCGILNVSEAF